MAEWVPIENSISLESLLKRWKGIEIDGAKIDFNIIDQLVRVSQLTAYDRKDWIVSGGHKEWRGVKRNPVLGLSGCEIQEHCDVLFNMQEVSETEKEFATPQSVHLQKDSIGNDGKVKMHGNKYVFAEHQLIKKGELYQRWIGATDEEKATHANNGELRTYKHYKGPINGVIWCTQGIVYYRGQVDYSRPDLHDYNDDSCDYFLVEDMKHLETEHPEYAGNVTPESLGLVQTGGSDVKKSMAVFPDEEIQIDKIRKALAMSPQNFVDFLNNRTANIRLITSWEESFREASIYNPYFTREDIQNENLTVNRLDWENFKQRERELEEATADVPFEGKPSRLSELESQLTEAQKQLEGIESARRWNEQCMTERAELEKSLAEKDVRITELEKELAAATASKGKLRKDFKNWQDALPMAVTATYTVIAAGKGFRSRKELRAICEMCNVSFSGVQFEAWRAALPEGYLDKDNRSALPTYPPNIGETLEGEE